MKTLTTALSFFVLINISAQQPVLFPNPDNGQGVIGQLFVLNNNLYGWYLNKSEKTILEIILGCAHTMAQK